MSKLATEAAGMCTDFAKALEALKEKVQRLCSSKEWEELRVDFSDLRTRALSIKAQVPAACVCGGEGGADAAADPAGTHRAAVSRPPGGTSAT